MRPTDRVAPALPDVLRGDSGESDSGIDSKLLEGVAEVSADGVRGDVQALGDLSVGEAVGDQPDDGELGVGHRRPTVEWAALGGQATSHAEAPEASADSRQIPACPTGGVDGEGAVEGGDGLMGASVSGRGDTEILEGGGQCEPSLTGLQDGDGLGQYFGVAGEQ